MAIAVPAFRDAALGSQLRAMSSDLVASAYLARSEAIKRNSAVMLCASSNGTSCTCTAFPCPSGNWQGGWIVLSGATVIQQHESTPPGYRISGATGLRFAPTGVGSDQATLIVCRYTPSVGREERVVTIDAVGRASVRKTTNGVCP